MIVSAGGVVFGLWCICIVGGGGLNFDCSHSTGMWAGSGKTSPTMSRPPDPRVTGLEYVHAKCPQAKVKYVNAMHVDFI